MNNDIEEKEKLKLEIIELKNKIKELEEKIKSYTNTERHKRYYENNKTIIKEKAKKYMKKIKENNPDKIKEWSHNAYLKKKEKLKMKDPIN